MDNLSWASRYIMGSDQSLFARYAKSFLQNLLAMRRSDNSKPLIKPLFQPAVRTRIEEMKEGKYGGTSVAGALYCNGWNPRSGSQFVGTQFVGSDGPGLGYVFDDGKNMFFLNYFRRPEENEDQPGFLCIVSPRGESCLDAVVKLTEKIFKKDMPVKGVYVRFLTSNQQQVLLQKGFSPIESHPWIADAPMEDETFQNSILNLDELLLEGQSIHRSLSEKVSELKVQVIPHLPPKYRRSARNTYLRFQNFLNRNNLSYNLRPVEFSDYDKILSIVKDHFSLIERSGKQCGSYAADYKGVVHLASFTSDCCFTSDCFSGGNKPSHPHPIISYIGFLGDMPVSFFCAESLDSFDHPKTSLGLYAALTLRDAHIPYLPPFSCSEDQARGFSAMPVYAYIECFKKFQVQGFKQVYLGGSETADLDRFKRHLGCRPDPSFWVVKVKQ